MSRGHGWMQRYLFLTISRHGKPITFAELRRIAIDPEIGFLSFSQERSLRRALHGLVQDQTLTALGKGGRAAPHRYLINPLLAAFAGDKEGFERLCKAIEEDKGGHT